MRDILRLTRLLCDKLEAVDPGFGVETMVLTAPVAEPLTPRFAANDLTEAPEPDVSELLDTLANRHGAGRLYRTAPAQSDVPERSVRKLDSTAPDTAEAWPARWPRPTRLLSRPEPIEAVAPLPDRPSVTFTWRSARRRVRGRKDRNESSGNGGGGTASSTRCGTTSSSRRCRRALLGLPPL